MIISIGLIYRIYASPQIEMPPRGLHIDGNRSGIAGIAQDIML
jgi:hypothetical protein